MIGYKPLVTLAGCVLLIMTLGCRKNELNKRTDTSKDHALAERLFADVFKVTLEAVFAVDYPEKSGEGRFFLGECAAIVIEQERDENGQNLLFSADFGIEGCGGDDGVLRSGQLQVGASDPFDVKGSQITVRFHDYSISNFEIDGTVAIIYRGKSEFGNPMYDVSVSDGSITDPGEAIISWECLYTWAQVDGNETPRFDNGEPGIFDDVYAVAGVASGQDHNGRGFSSEIMFSLEIGGACNWVQSGKEQIRPEGLLHRELNYGNGVCDAAALVEIEDENYEVSIR